MTSRRVFLGRLAAASGAVIGAPYILGARRGVEYDLILRGGVVVDGSGRPRFSADVAITGDRIVRVAPGIVDGAKRVIDCSGHIVAPGFVDIHSHADSSLFDDPMLESVVRQGITTVVVGADGSSRAPGLPGRGASMRTLFASIDALRPGANVASCIGLGTVRGVVVGDRDRPATAAELARMVRFVEHALADGAAGASSGLEYTPGAFASLDELIALCKPLAAHGLAYSTHMRNEDDRLLAAIDESIAVARGAGCALQISHLKTQGPRNWPKLNDAFARIEAARASGVDVAFDRYPYLAYQTGLTNFFPVWSRDGGIARFFERLDDPATAARIREETIAKAELIGGWNNVQISSAAASEDKPAEGRRLGEWASERGIEPYQLAIGMLRRNGGNVGIVGFAMSEENLERIIAHDAGMVASDGNAVAMSGPARRGVPHPRGAGSFARVLGRYVRERGTLTLEQAVRKLSAFPASRMRLTDRGTLAAGSVADVVVFDAATVNDRATFSDPFQYPVGIKATIVNGATALLDGARGDRTGRVVRPVGPAQAVGISRTSVQASTDDALPLKS